MSRTNKTEDNSKKFTIPRNSVFIAVNDCWATQDQVAQQGIAGGLAAASTRAEVTTGSGGVIDEKKRYRQPVIKAESLPQYCDKSDSIERTSFHRRSSNEIGSTSICYATFSKGMHKPQHIYENDCIIQRPSISSRGVCATALPLTGANESDDNPTATAANTVNPNHSLYAVVNKNNKSKNKQSNEMPGLQIGQQAVDSQNKTVTTVQAVAAAATNVINNNHNNYHNNNINAKIRTNSHVSSSSSSSSCSRSDIMGNMLQADSAISEAGASGLNIGGLRFDHQHHHQGSSNKPVQTSNKFDPIVTTTTITSDAVKNDSNAEHSIYAKVWKGPRKTSESKMYANILFSRTNYIIFLFCYYLFIFLTLYFLPRSIVIQVLNMNKR